MLNLPFRIKLTFIIAAIIVSVLLAIFTIVQDNIEAQFRLEIESQIEQVSGLITQSMDDRYELLRSDAKATAEDSLIRDILIDKTLPAVTRDDIIQNEVMPKFGRLNLLAITNTDGQLLATNHSSDFDAVMVTDQIIQLDWFKLVFEGEDIAGYVLVDDQYYQAIAMPVFLSNQMIGVSVVARLLDHKNLDKMKKVGHVDLALLDQNQRISSTDWSALADSKQLMQTFDSWLTDTDNGVLLPPHLIETKFGQERFLLRFVTDPTDFVPPLVIVRSLDEALSFVRNIKAVILLVGLVAILISLLVSFVVAVGVSKPIRLLQSATEQVGKENFDVSVDIRSRDEFAALGQSFNQMIKGLAEKNKIRSAFDKSVSKEIADHMLEQGVELGGIKQNVSILFADIRGFTKLAEKMDEKKLINLLNDYFTAVNQSIIKHKGLIDKFIGDAVMALFGTPVALENSSAYAINAALDMLGAVETFNLEVANQYQCEIKIGIGINTGQVVAGLVGSKERLNFTVLGDHVNLASRIEGLSKFYGAELVISELTLNNFNQHKKGENDKVFRCLDKVMVRGRTQGIKVFQPMLLSNEPIQQKENIQQYEMAVTEVQQGQLKKAIERLSRLTQVWVDDKPTAILLQHAKRYIENSYLYQQDYQQGVRVHTAK